jgi:hypothetical protein
LSGTLAPREAKELCTTAETRAYPHQATMR